MKKDLYLLEGFELIPDIDFEHSRSFQNDWDTSYVDVGLVQTYLDLIESQGWVGGLVENDPC